MTIMQKLEDRKRSIARVPMTHADVIVEQIRS